MNKKKKIKEKEGNPNGVTQSIINTVETYPDTFSWTPSLSINPISKKELIHELKNGGKIGNMYIERVIHGTMRRMEREAKKREATKK